MKTIAKNRARVIAEIRDTITRCVVYTLENQFHGAEVDQANAWHALHRYDVARLVEMEPGRRWQVNVHDNRWYELHADPAPKPDPTQPDREKGQRP